MKTLVTGATGLVGRHLVDKLIKESYEVVALGRNQELLSLLAEKGATTLTFDLTKDEEYQKLKPFRGYVWIHAAAAISGAKKEVLDQVNIQGTQKLVAKGEELEIPRFILISSISTYSIDLTGKIDSHAEQNPESYYGQTKLEQEKIVLRSKLDYTIIRPPYIGGPFDTNFLEEFAKRIEDHKMPTFSKDGKISYVDARDLASAVHLIIQNKETMGKSYNIISDVRTHSEVVEEIGDQLGVEPPFGPKYPYTLAMIIGIFGEIAAKLKGKSSERSISRYRIKTLCRQFELDPSNLIKDTGYEPEFTISSSVSDWIATREKN